MEYLIYCFNYNTGRQRICNFYDTEDVDLRATLDEVKPSPIEQALVHGGTGGEDEDKQLLA